MQKDPVTQRRKIDPARLKAFSDGALAIIVTIMVLEIRPPEGTTLASLRPLALVFLSYVLSFTVIGIYWNNHHHLLEATDSISGVVMWANLHLLFWLSLIPFGTIWIGLAHAYPWPAAVYGMIALIMAGVAYFLLVKTILACNEGDAIAKAIGSDTKGKLSVVIYASGALLAFVNPWLAYAMYALVSIMWFVPDPRLEYA